jgi:hypothetical protein
MARFLVARPGVAPDPKCGLPSNMRYPRLNPSGCSAAAAHVLWEHEVVGSNPTTPTTILPGGSADRGDRKPADRGPRFGRKGGPNRARIPEGTHGTWSAVGRTATNGLRVSSPTPGSTAVLRVLQRKPATLSARRRTRPICCKVRNVDPDPRALIRARRGRVRPWSPARSAPLPRRDRLHE